MRRDSIKYSSGIFGRPALLTLLVSTLIISITLGFGRWWPVAGEGEAASRVRPSLAALVGDVDARGFKTADAPWTFDFPSDHGAHPGFATEAWQFTGNLEATDGRRFGFQLGFFRLGLGLPGDQDRFSAWAATDAYRAQFTLTDVTTDRFYAGERINRAALGLAGAQTSPIRIWVENWVMTMETDDKERGAIRLDAADADHEIMLRLQADKPPVHEGGTPGTVAAMHTYTLSRMRAEGTLRAADEAFSVKGSVWLDRGWGTLPIPDGQVVWDRFLLHLDDGHDVAVFSLRRRRGARAPVNTALIVAPDGTVRGLGREQVSLDVLAEWRSPRDGTEYPGKWRLRIPAQNLELDLSPEVSDQEVDLWLQYWGGNVQAVGSSRGHALTGRGYAELTGYE